MTHFYDNEGNLLAEYNFLTEDGREDSDYAIQFFERVERKTVYIYVVDKNPHNKLNPNVLELTDRLHEAGFVIKENDDGIIIDYDYYMKHDLMHFKDWAEVEEWLNNFEGN